MSLIEFTFESRYLQMDTTITVCIPSYKGALDTKIPIEDVYRKNIKFPVLYLLHGLNADHSSWQRFSSIERYAESKQIVVVMPSAYNSCYTDMMQGVSYYSFMSKELTSVVQTLFPVSDKREDHFVAGLSMGGRGAFLWAMREPEYFSAAACISGSLDVATMAERYLANGETEKVIRYDAIYGGVQNTRNTVHDVYWLAKELVASGKELPKFLYSCGLEDPRYKEQFIPFMDYAQEIELPIDSDLDHGMHDFDYWDPAIKRALDWMPIRPVIW